MHRYILSLALLLIFGGVNAGTPKPNRLPKIIPYLYANGKFGFVDQTGKQILAPKYDNVYTVGYPGIYSVYVGKILGVVDSTGKEVIAPIYAGINVLGRDGYCMQNTEGKSALFSASGIQKTEFIYETINYGRNGLLPFTRGGKRGYLNLDGKEVIAPTYKFANSFNNGKTVVTDFPAVPTESNSDSHIIDVNGKVLFTANHSISIIGDDKILHKEAVKGSYLNSRIYITNFKGEITKELKCEGDLDMSIDSYNWSDGLCKFKCSGKSGYVDLDLNIIIPARYNDAKNFNRGRAAVKDGEKWYFINVKGEPVFEFKYSTKGWLGVPSFSGNYLEVYDDVAKKPGILDQAGKIVIPFTYESVSIGDWNAGLFVAKKDGKFGLIDAAQTTIIPFKYDKMSSYKVAEYIFQVERDGKSFYIDQTGKEYRDL